MKVIHLILILTLSAAGISAQPPSDEFYNQIGKSKAELFLKKAHFVENTSYADYDLIYQRMNWEIDPSVLYISGAITSYFISKTEQLTTIQFDLVDNMIVDSVKSHNAQLNFQHQNNLINTTLTSQLSTQKIDSLTIFYRGVPDETGHGSFVKSEHESVPIIWTLSEPYGAKDWWPCKQSLTDKIDSIDVIVTCPKPYRTASNGILISETFNGDTRTMHWKHRFPIATYLVAIAVTNYVNYSGYVDVPDANQIEILNYIYPESLDYAIQQTPQAVEIMELYNRLFGIYPFAREKYGHAQFGWRGGMEHQTMSFMFDLEFHLTAHEMSHQWFGDCVTLGSWHDIWLNEGFATWVTGLAYENLLDGLWWSNWRRSTVDNIISEPDGSVYVPDTTDVSRVFNGRLSYSKGSYLLHMLRWILGDDVVFEAVNNYLTDPDIAYGFASQQKLVEHFENVADTSLTEFFSDWYYGEGYPVYSIQFSQNSDDSLKIELFQAPTHASVSFFEMPVPVRCYNSGKTDSVDFRLENYFSGQEYFLNPGFQVSEIKIDPDLWLICRTGQALSVPWKFDNNSISIFPNPVSTNLKIAKPFAEEITSIEICSVNGNVVLLDKSGKTSIDVSNLPNGTYFITVITSQKKMYRKICKTITTS